MHKQEQRHLHVLFLVWLCNNEEKTW